MPQLITQSQGSSLNIAIEVGILLLLYKRLPIENEALKIGTLAGGYYLYNEYLVPQYALTNESPLIKASDENKILKNIVVNKENISFHSKSNNIPQIKVTTIDSIRRQNLKNIFGII